MVYQQKGPIPWLLEKVAINENTNYNNQNMDFKSCRTNPAIDVRWPKNASGFPTFLQSTNFCPEMVDGAPRNGVPAETVPFPPKQTKKKCRVWVVLGMLNVSHLYEALEHALCKTGSFRGNKSPSTKVTDTYWSTNHVPPFHDIAMGRTSTWIHPCGHSTSTLVIPSALNPHPPNYLQLTQHWKAWQNPCMNIASKNREVKR